MSLFNKTLPRGYAEMVRYLVNLFIDIVFEYYVFYLAEKISITLNNINIIKNKNTMDRHST